MSEEHKLAVILFADIAGYTAMMEEDEAAALVALGRFKEVKQIYSQLEVINENFGSQLGHKHSKMNGVRA